MQTVCLLTFYWQLQEILIMQQSIVTAVILVLWFSLLCGSHPVRKKRDFITCPPHDDDQNPLRFPNPADCGKFFECNTSVVPVSKSCEYGYWFNKKVKDCADVDDFSPKEQQLCFNKIRAPGSTRNLKEVFIGRCIEYQQLKQPQLFVNGAIDCKDLFKKFTKAFLNKNPCGQVKFGAYEKFLEATNLPLLPKDKLLFWSSINEFSQEYANGGKRLFTLEETLPGFLLNQLTWCGKKGGINYQTCPTWGVCDHHPMVTFWEEASQNFAKIAVDTITLMLNGSMQGRNAFRPNSFFAQHELPSLTRKVTKVRIWVAHGLDIPVQETCTKGSLRDLQRQLAKRGFNFNCQDNPAEILHLLCVNNPFHSKCRTIKPKKDKWNDGRLFGFTVKSVESDGK